MKVHIKCADVIHHFANASIMILLAGFTLACKSRQHIVETQSFHHIEQLAGLHIIDKDTLLFFPDGSWHVSQEPDQLPPLLSSDTASGNLRPLAVVRHREIQADASSIATTTDTTTTTTTKLPGHASFSPLPNTGLIIIAICYIFCGLLLASIFIIILRKI